VTQLPLELPPVPVSAIFSAGTGNFTVVFDKTLDANTGSPLRWAARWQNNSRTLFGVVGWNGFNATGFSNINVPDIGADFISYDGLDPDLKGTNGKAVAAFSIVPTMVP